MRPVSALCCLAVSLGAFGANIPAASADELLLQGKAAFGDWHSDRPGVRRRIMPADLPKPFATRSANNMSSEEEPPRDAMPQVPEGFSATRFATGLEGPRILRVAPNGDVFASEMVSGQIRVLHARDGAATADSKTVFAKDLEMPFGIAFYPPGPDPRWVYVANTNSIVRFPYRLGDTEARGQPETIVARLTRASGGHATRDIRFSNDGKRMFVSVGSFSNAGETLPPWDKGRIESWQATHSLGAAWGEDTDRADVIVFDPQGRNRKVFATGIRNCVGLAINPKTEDVWCSTNERDGLGDDLVPDYVTRVKEGAWYGWPWYYIGANEDPRQKGRRPDLAGKATVPDVLIQPHSASLGMTFYDPAEDASASFPSEYHGDAFAAFHGSWNRSQRTGYKVVRIRMKDGVATGEYDDFMTGFVISNDKVWGRPVGVATAHDGALLVSEDANGTIWRVAPAARKAGP